MSQDRRQFQRIPLGASVAFQELTFERATQPAQTVYKDVSGGGLLLASTHECPLGTILKLEIRVPGWGRHHGSAFGPAHELDQRPLIAVGQVVRVEALEDGEFELGIKFLNVYPDDLQALLKFIQASAPAEHA